MKLLPLKLAVVFQVAGARVSERTKSAMADERGELGSWMILAAGLAVAAGIAVGTLSGWFVTKTNAIITN